MDENTRQMMEQLKSNPAALRKLMQSRDGQTLMQALTRRTTAQGFSGRCRPPCRAIPISWPIWSAGSPKARRAPPCWSASAAV